MIEKGRELIRQYCVRTYNGNYGLGMMFEEEAKISFDELDDRGVGDDWSIEESYVNGFSNGAKFGYNKAKVEVEESYRESLCNAELNLASVTEQLEELEKANEWHYVKEGCKYPENGESVLVTVLDDDNEKIVTMALFEVENNKRFWDIESRLCSIHSGSEEVCSKIIAWARVLPAGGEK